MNCKNCNSPLAEGTVFCPNCGQKLEETVTPVVTPTPMVPEQPVVTEPVVQPTTVVEQPAEVLEVENEVNTAAATVNQTAPVMPTPEPTPIQPAPAYVSAPAPRKSKAPLIIGLVIGGVVLILAIIAIIFRAYLPILKDIVNNGNNTPTAEPTPSNSTTPAGYKDFSWTYGDVDNESYTISILYNKGIEDNFKVYGNTTYKELAQVLYDNVQYNDTYGETHYINKKMLNKVASFYFINADEYKNFGLLDDKQTFEVTWSILATLAFEFDEDSFMPESALYDANTNDYYFYGPLQGPDENGLQNVGNAVINFGNGQMFSGVMCGDYIYWKFNPSNPTVFYLGTDMDDLTAYNVPGFETMAGYMNEAIEKLY